MQLSMHLNGPIVSMRLFALKKLFLFASRMGSNEVF